MVAGLVPDTAGVLHDPSQSGQPCLSANPYSLPPPAGGQGQDIPLALLAHRLVVHIAALQSCHTYRSSEQSQTYLIGQDQWAYPLPSPRR